MKHSAAEIAQILLEAGAVALSPARPFRFASGILSPVYCDNRLLLGQVSARKAIAAALAERVEEEIVSAEVIAGTATAGIPWAAWVAGHASLPMVYVRSGAKKHGRGQQVEGGLQAGQRVVLIEDLVSTGGSALDAVAALRQLDASVSDCCCIFSYEMADSAQRFGAAGVRLLPLTTLGALLEVAASQNYIQPEHRELIADWAADPAGWAVRAGLDAEGTV
ncbi:MAG TPA: orotate phosphoribosyltransferase [Herpetosiphonaceae bacterium]|nr:orotate phosphoribosyltransferase [Herpetosiphonaceae bacterium]